MFYYKMVKTNINVVEVAKVFINIEVRYDGFREFYLTNRDIFFASKFMLLICYF